MAAARQTPGTLPQGHHATLLATGLEEAIGSTIGPDGALYVAQGTLGRIARVDPRTGKITTFASGLPKQLSKVGLGGAMDVAFIGKTAYVLVTLVSADVGGHNLDGIYRMDGPDQFTVVADIGAFNIGISRPSLRSIRRPASCTRCNPTVAGSWSAMGTSTASCRSPSTARSP